MVWSDAQFIIDAVDVMLIFLLLSNPLIATICKTNMACAYVYALQVDIY